MLFETFARTASARGDDVAIVNERDAVSFSTLLARVRALAPRLTRHVGRAGVLGLYVSNPVDFVSVYLAAAATGTRLVLLDARLARDEIEAQLRDFEITHVAASEALAGALAGALEDGPRPDPSDRPLRFARVRGERPGQGSRYLPGDFVVHCTSGTTGKAKGIVLSDENIAQRVIHWSNTLELTTADTILCTLTLAHCHGIDVLMLPGLLRGGAVIAPDLERLSPRRVCALIAKHGVTVYSTLPYMYDLIVQTVAPAKADFSRVRYLISGSAPLPDDTAATFARVFGAPIHQVYGLSEIGAICFNKAPENIGSIGELIEGVEGRLVDGDDGPGAELVVRGPALARGYLDSPESQRLMFRDGWLWTQDLMRYDRGAGYKIQGRKSRFINVGGNKVDPVELERLLRAHPAVTEAVVTARRDSLRSEQIIAFIEARAAVEQGLLHAYLRDQVASYKLPHRYVFVDEIPRNALGKVQVAKLMESAPSA